MRDPNGVRTTGARTLRRLSPAALLAAAFLGAAAAAAAAPAAPPAAAPAYDIERYLQIRSASSAGISPDGRTVLYLTKVTGTDQAWTVPAEGGWPEQITFFEDSVDEAFWSPRGDRIAVAHDRGGDENYQIALVAPDGSNLVPLTGAPKVRHNLGGFSRDGRMLSWSSNERDARVFDVQVLDLDGGRTLRVTAEEANFFPGPFSDDGRRLAVVRNNGSMDDDLFVVDLPAGPGGAAGRPIHLTPHEGRARYRPIGWSPDGRALWLLSDAGREFLALGRLDVGARAIEWIHAPRWDVEAAALTRDGRLLALSVNEDGYDVLRLLETAGGKERPAPALPRGQIAGLSFSADGRRLTLSVGGAARNPDVWIADLGGPGGRPAARQVTRSTTAGIPPASFVEPSLVRYRTPDGLEIPAFLYLPPGPAAARPAIVMPHGGPEGQWVARFSPVTQYLVRRGYALLQPNVRGSIGYGRAFSHLDDGRKREDSVRDLVAGVEWLKGSGHADPRRIAVMGGSYGGYMTLAAVTLYPDLWAAAVSSYGIANFRTFFGRTASYRVRHRAAEYGDPVADAEFLDSISPIHKVDRIKTPLLVLQGANDPRVPVGESEQIVAAVRGRGGVAEYVLFPDEGHGWTRLANQVRAYRATAEFLDRHLRGAGAPQE